LSLSKHRWGDVNSYDPFGPVCKRDHESAHAAAKVEDPTRFELWSKVSIDPSEYVRDMTFAYREELGAVLGRKFGPAELRKRNYSEVGILLRRALVACVRS